MLHLQQLLTTIADYEITGDANYSKKKNTLEEPADILHNETDNQ